MSVDPRLRTRVTTLFGVEVPVVQTGMGWVSVPSLVAATAEAGALGILAAATTTLDGMSRAVDEVRARTDRPFGVNLRADAVDVDERLGRLIAAGVRVVSFAGAPRRELVERLHDAGIVVVATIGAPRHAEKVAQVGVDVVIAQGAEGGGHTGRVPTSLLVPAVLDVVDVPVLAAGGFHDGRGLAAALAWGCDGIAMGTRFLLTSDSPVPGPVKEAYLATPVTGTLVSRAIDGAPQRVIRTPLVEALEKGRLTRFPRALANAWRFRSLTGTGMVALVREGIAMRRSAGLTWSQVLMAANAPMMTRATMVEGRLDVGVLPTGQVVGVIDDLPTCAELVERIVTGAVAALDRIGTVEG